MNKIINTLLNLRNTFHHSPKDTNTALVSIESSLAEAIWLRNYDLIDNIQILLQDVAAGKRPKEQDSYNLGKAHSMCEVISYLNGHVNIEIVAKDICSTQQFTVLKFISNSGEAIPTDIVTKLGMKKNQVSNILRQLLLKELVHMLPVGRNHWYSLSAVGKSVLLQATRIETNKQVIWRFYYLLKNYESSIETKTQRRDEDPYYIYSNFIYDNCEKLKFRTEKCLFEDDIRVKTKTSAKGNIYAEYGQRTEFYPNRSMVQWSE